MASAFYCFRQLSLVNRADTADSPWKDFPSLGNEMGEKPSILEINVGDLLCAELADPFSPDGISSRTNHNPLLLQIKSGEFRSQNPEVRIQESEVRSQKS